MRIFINNVDSLSGLALCSEFRNFGGRRNRLFGTLTHDNGSRMVVPPSSYDAATFPVPPRTVRRVVARSRRRGHHNSYCPQQFLKTLLSCCIIVYDLHNADFEEVEFILRELSIAKFEKPTVFILISSVIVWANTRPLTSSSSQLQQKSQELVHESSMPDHSSSSSSSNPPDNSNATEDDENTAAPPSIHGDDDSSQQQTLVASSNQPEQVRPFWEVLQPWKKSDDERKLCFLEVRCISDTHVNFWEIPNDGDDFIFSSSSDDSAVSYKPPTPPPCFVGEEFERRQPWPKFSGWKTLETLAMSLSSEQSKSTNLTSFVVAAGIPYGNGEGYLFPLLKSAWLSEEQKDFKENVGEIANGKERKRVVDGENGIENKEERETREEENKSHPLLLPLSESHPQQYLHIIGSGQNFIPTVHIRDVVKLVAALCSTTLLGESQEVSHSASPSPNDNNNNDNKNTQDVSPSASPSSNDKNNDNKNTKEVSPSALPINDNNNNDNKNTKDVSFSASPYPSDDKNNDNKNTNNTSTIKTPFPTKPLALSKYHIAVDISLETQASLLQAIVDTFSTPRKLPHIAENQVIYDELADVLTVNLCLQSSPLMLAPNFSWHCKEGLRVNSERIAEEFCHFRNLHPLRILIVGPPGSGKSFLGASLASQYGIQHLTQEDLRRQLPPSTETEMAAEGTDRLEKQKREGGGKIAMESGDVVKSSASVNRHQDKRENEKEIGENKKKEGEEIEGEESRKTISKIEEEREKLLSNLCRFRGFVLDGYPVTYEEADKLFIMPIPSSPVDEAEENKEEDDLSKGPAGEGKGENVTKGGVGEGDNEHDDEDDDETEEDEEDDDEEDDEEKKEEEEIGKEGEKRGNGGIEMMRSETIDKQIMPEFVVVLKSSEEQCKQRLMEIPQSEVIKGYNDEEGFKARFDQYQKANDFHQYMHNPSPTEIPPADTTVTTTRTTLSLIPPVTLAEFFQDRGVEVLTLKVDDRREEDLLASLRIYIERGCPLLGRNLFKSQKEVLREREAYVQELEEQDSKQKEEKTKQDLAEEEEQKKRERQEEAVRLRRIAQHEEEMLEARSLPLRKYLMRTVVPTLIAGLVEVCRVRPKDTIDYLAEYLFAHAEDGEESDRNGKKEDETTSSPSKEE